MIKKHSRTIHFFAGPLLFLLLALAPLDNLSAEGKAVLASTAWVAYWWITEAVELPVASILPILIFPLSGALPLAVTTAAYGNPFIFLFLGGFIIGLAIEKWNLHQRIAYKIIQTIGTSEKRVLLGFMLATAFLSMWISNTATAIMMLPIGVSVASQFKGRDTFSKNLMLGIAYSASIGGMATLIGTPPNIILAAVVKESLNQEIFFADWMLFAAPFSLLLLILCWLILSRNLATKANANFQFTSLKLDKISLPEKRVLAIFSLTTFLWVTRTFILNPFLPQLDDTMIAITGALLLFITPAGKGSQKLMDWKTAARLPWDVLLIFGAGLAIAKGFSETDLTAWLASHLAVVPLLPAVVLLIVIAAINFLTEITSNTATASILLPLLFTLSISLDMQPLPMLIGAALAASCAFMLPVATPPNAIVFSSGQVQIRDMLRTGILLNLISILLIYLFVTFLAGEVFTG